MENLTGKPKTSGTLCNMKKNEKKKELTRIMKKIKEPVKDEELALSLKKKLGKKISLKRLHKQRVKKKVDKIKNRNKSKYSFQDFKDEVALPRLSTQGKKYFNCLFNLLDSPFETVELEETTYLNVLNEIHGQEFFLSTNKLSQRCLQLIILRCNNSSLIRKFIENYTKDVYVICIDLIASYITQALLVACLQFIQNEKKSKILKNDCDFFEKWVNKVANFCLENLEDFIFHENNSTYVIRTLLFVLSGNPIYPDITRDIRKFVKEQKEIPDSKFLSPTLQEQHPDTPESFIIMFNLFVNKLSNNKIRNIMIEQKGAPIIEILLLTVHASDRRLYKAVTMNIIKRSFQKLETESVSEIFGHPNAFYVVERIVELADFNKRQWLWLNFFDEQFYDLCINSRTKYIAQKIISSCTNKDEFQKIFQRIEPMIEELIKQRSCLTLAKFALMCINLQCCQEKFLKAMMISLQCYRPEKRQIDLAILLLNFESYENFHSRSEPQLVISLCGSLIVQYLFQFPKPRKILKSILRMPVELLVHLASLCDGYSVFDALFKCSFFQESDQVNFIKKMKPHLRELAFKPYGSQCLLDIWKEASMTVKALIIEELSKSSHILKNDIFGAILYEKFAIYKFHSHFEEWEILQSLTTKRKPQLKKHNNKKNPQLKKNNNNKKKCKFPINKN